MAALPLPAPCSLRRFADRHHDDGAVWSGKIKLCHSRHNFYFNGQDFKRAAAGSHGSGSDIEMRAVLKVLGALVGSIVSGIGLLVAVFLFLPRCDIDSKPFDSIAWKGAPTSATDETRLFMVDDLLAEHALVGSSRTDVVNLLGQPDSTPYFRAYDMVYHLGRERRAFGIDSEWLVLKLSQGRVSEARVVTD